MSTSDMDDVNETGNRCQLIDIRWYHKSNLVTPGKHSSKPNGFEELIILENR